MNSYNSMGQYQAEEGEQVSHSSNQVHTDEEFFSSFINYDPSSSVGAAHDHNYRFALSPNYSQALGSYDPEGVPQPDLLDAIVNLTVKSRSSASLHDAASYNDSLLLNRIASPTPTGHTQSMISPSRIFDSAAYPAPLPRSISDPVGHTRATSPTPSETTAGAVAELSNLFGTNNGDFNFQMPYYWQSGHVLPDSSSVPQSRILIPHSNSQPHSFHEHSHSFHESHSFGDQPFSLPRHDVTPQQPIEPPSGQNKLSTRLIYVNGQPSHIELTHDNSTLQPNPIILPISSVIKENN
ncbi:hypothetical protein GGI16_004754 [Coemansia sp. S142-1]|nr:hypothetical protein GGI16_004754 [Coemansia sp. S142-1]